VASLAGATQDEVRRHNVASLLRYVHENGSASRSELVQHTGLNRSTIGVLTTELADAGLVVQTSTVGQGVGRPSICVEPVANSAYVLAIHLRIERTTAALIGLGGTVLKRREVRHRRSGYNVPIALRDTVKIAEQMLADAPADSRCVGVGVAVPGVVRQPDGLVHTAPNLGWVDVPLGEELTRLLSLNQHSSVQVQVGNDADMGVVAEWVRGAARGRSNVVYLYGEVGVGGGIVLDGRPMVGSGGYGGEVGHMIVNPRGRACQCGSTGCWETEIGENAVLAAAGFGPGEGSVSQVVEMAAASRAVNNRLAKVGDWIGLGVANLVNIFNPEIVVLGGKLAEVLPAVAGRIDDSVNHSLIGLRGQVHVEAAALGQDSTLFGAAEVAFNALLEDPLGPTARDATLTGSG